MSIKCTYEITGGSFLTPEKEKLEIPPEKSVRKDIVEGELAIKTEKNSAREQAVVNEAKKYGITEIPKEKLTARDIER